MLINNRKAGFTLVETLIYMALIIFVVGAGIMSAYYIIDGSAKESGQLSTLAESEFLLRKIDWALTGADSVSVPSADTLIVNKAGQVLTFEPNGMRVELKRGASTNFLTSDRVAITALNFAYTNNTPPELDSVQVNFVADGRSFESIKYLRVE